jgi:aspartate-semialdehyde dehydrogenase
VAVVGATGAVGVEMIETLEKRGFPESAKTYLDAEAPAVDGNLVSAKSASALDRLILPVSI